MKLNELNEKIATACDMRPKAVLAVQRETFRMIDEALNKGERVVVPGFGAFSMREIEQEGGAPKKAVRFRRKEEAEADAEAAAEAPVPTAPEEKKARRGKKRARKSAKNAGEQAGEPAAASDESE